MISGTVRENLLALADAYAKGHKLSMATVSSKIHGKGSFFDQFRAGTAGIRLENVDVLVQKFADGWPLGTPWPKLKPIAMERPSKTVDKSPK